MRAYGSGIMLAALLAGVACGGDGGTGPSASDITGTWQLTKMLFVNQANSQESVDVIALGGVVTLELKADKTFIIDMAIPSNPPETDTGTWSISGDVLTIVPISSSGNMQFNVSLSGDTLTLSGANADFDVDNDGLDEACKLTMVGTR